MKIVIEGNDGNFTITEVEDGSESDIINAYAIALAMKCMNMFKTPEVALEMLDIAYNFSKNVIMDEMEDEQ